MKPRLTVLLGAGSTISLRPDIPSLCGMPSTADLTACISRMQFPRVVRTGTPFLQTDGDKNPFVTSEGIPVLRLLTRALSSTFASVNFELILHAIEQLLPLASMRAGDASWDQFHPAIGAFVEMLKHYEILNDWSLLRVTRECVISAIHSEIHNRSFQLPKELPLHKLIAELAQEFRLAVFTLNYDDVVDGACPGWFDGFVGKKESAGGEHIGKHTLSTLKPSICGGTQINLSSFTCMEAFALGRPGKAFILSNTAVLRRRARQSKQSAGATKAQEARLSR